MNKKIILVVAILLIVAVVFVACKGKEDVEATTESTTEAEETTELILQDFSDGDTPPAIIPEIYNENTTAGEGDVIVIGGQEDGDTEDSISWDEVVGK